MAKRGVHINVYKTGPTTWRCDLKINASDTGGGLTARGVADTMKGYNLRHAVRGALTIAQQALANPAIAAVFPAYAKPALAALHAVQVAQKRGLLGKVSVKLQDPTLRKLVRELAELEQGKRSAMSGGGVVLCEGGDDDELGVGPVAAMLAAKYGPQAAKAIAARLKQRKKAKAARRLAAAKAAQALAQRKRDRQDDDQEDDDQEDEDTETAGVEPPAFGLQDKPGKFGLPVGNPHPFAASVATQIARGAGLMGACDETGCDDSELARLAAAHEHQRARARRGGL